MRILLIPTILASRDPRTARYPAEGILEPARAHLSLWVRSHLILHPFEHKIRPHSQLCPTHDIITRVDQETMLEEQDAAHLWLDIETLFHAHRPERRGASFEWLIVWLVVGVVEIEVEREVAPLLLIGSFVRAVAVCWKMRVSFRAIDESKRRTCA
jgi:hypothetical protein